METYVKPDFTIIELDIECICGNPHSAGNWKPGNGKPPWAGGPNNAQEYRNNLWEDE